MFTALLLFVVAVHAQAQAREQTPAQRYQSIPVTQDGIGKRYMGREIAGVMGWQAAGWLERGQREREERSDLLMRALALQADMVVADIGAGTGYYSRRIAARLGPRGRVYAVDVQPEMLALLRENAVKAGLHNIEPVLAAPDDVHLPAESIDLALLVDVYHELSAPYEVLASTVRALRPGGRVVFVEYRAEDPAVPIRPLHKMSEAQVRREATPHGLRWQTTVRSLPWQHVVVFVKN